jgi:hypothetical protein
MELELRTDVAPDLALELASVIGGLRLLEDLIRWGFAATPRRELADVIVQDEYNHDIILRYDARHVLVFEST